MLFLHHNEGINDVSNGEGDSVRCHTYMLQIIFNFR